MSQNLNIINPSVAQERQKRLDLFPQLSDQEIAKRQNIELGWQDVLQIMATQFKNGNPALDFRYYKTVVLGNTILSSVPDKCLQEALKYSKYNQDLFVLFNFGDQNLSVNIGSKQIPNLPNFPPFTQKATLPRGTEIVINCSNVGNVGGNIKITPKLMPFSMMFDAIGAMNLDTREAASFSEVAEYVFSTRGDNSLTGHWDLKLFSIASASISSADPRLPKMTTGSVDNVYNESTTEIKFFNYSAMSGNPVYYDTDGQKLIPTQKLSVDQADLDGVKVILERLKTEQLSDEQFSNIYQQLGVLFEAFELDEFKKILELIAAGRK